VNDSRFKTLRHIETVRNYMNAIICELMKRQEQHDQSKLQSPEVEYFDKYTPLLRSITYGSDEYKRIMEEMRPAITHHNQSNRHHPEFHGDGISRMNLIDLIEMMCDWKAAGMRHADGNLFKSLLINKKRFGISDQLYEILYNTAAYLEFEAEVFCKAEES